MPARPPSGRSYSLSRLLNLQPPRQPAYFENHLNAAARRCNVKMKHRVIMVIALRARRGSDNTSVIIVKFRMGKADDGRVSYIIPKGAEAISRDRHLNERARGNHSPLARQAGDGQAVASRRSSRTPVSSLALYHREMMYFLHSRGEIGSRRKRRPERSS